MTHGVTSAWVAQRKAKAAAPVVGGWKNGALTIWLEGKPWNPQAGDLRHPMKKARTVAAWRERTANHLLMHAGSVGYIRGVPAWPWAPATRKAVTFTVYSRKLFDDDNLAAVCKPVRDALKDMRVIDDDGNDRAGKPRHDFKYRNVRAPKKSDVHGIAIRIELAGTQVPSEVPA